MIPIKYVNTYLDDGKFYYEDLRIDMNKKCNCHLYFHQVCDICQKVNGKMKDKNMNQKFNEAADVYLESLYQSVGAISAEQKYNTIYMKFGYHLDNAVINYSINSTWEQKQTMMEYELLEHEGLIKIVYA